MKMKLFTLILLYLTLFNSLIYSQWIRQTNGLPSHWSNVSSIDACDNFKAVIGAYNPYILKTEDSGNNWTAIPFPAFVTLYGSTSIYEQVVDISIIDKTHFWICTDAGRILATSDGGTSWSVQFFDTTKTIFMDYIKMFDLNNGIAMGDAVSNNPALFLKTTDGGSNWISENDSTFIGASSGATWARLDFTNINTGYFRPTGFINQKLYKTNDSGRNWFSTNFPYEGSELVKFYNENLGLVVNMLYYNQNISWQMCRTKDGGNSWQTFNLSSTAHPIDLEFVTGNPSKVWYVDLQSLYYSSDTGRTWTEQKIYNGQLWGRDLKFTDSTHGWLICDSGKVFYTSNNGGVIADISSNGFQMPKEYLLMQNYPNPFNPSTSISYKLKETGHVVLTVFDIMGREVTLLVNSIQRTGEHSIKFDGTNLPSGMYIYQLKTNGYISSRKMLLLK